MWILVLLATFAALAFGVSFVYDYRNDLVYKLRTDCVLKCAAQEDFTVYDSGPTYDQMMWQFRKTKYEDFYGEKK